MTCDRVFLFQYILCFNLIVSPALIAIDLLGFTGFLLFFWITLVVKILGLKEWIIFGFWVQLSLEGAYV